MKFATALALCFALSTATLAQTVAVVAADGTGDFTSMQDAVDGVASGSTLVVRDGTYSSPTIDKSLTVIADRGAFVLWLGTTDVLGLSASDLVVLRGVRVEVSGSSGPHAVSVSGPGNLWLEDCDLVGALVPQSGASHALNAVGGSSVYVTRCDLSVGNGGFFAEVEALNVEASTVFVHESTISAGLSVSEAWPAATVTDGFVYFSGSTVLGGDGVDGFAFPPFPGTCATSGAPALSLAGTATAATIGTNLVGGAAGGNDPCVPSTAVPGEPFEGPVGSVDELAGTARRFFATGEDSVGGAVTGGEDLTLFYGGDLGDLALLRISASVAPAYFSPFAGTVVSLSGTTRILGLLTTPSFPTPASLAVTISTQPLDPSETIVSAFVQGVFANASGEVFLGPGSLVQVLADGILTPSTL